jgi:hypothetical protein
MELFNLDRKPRWKNLGQQKDVGNARSTVLPTQGHRRGARNFPWEYPLPDNKFWGDLSFATARTFLESISAEDAPKLPIVPDSTLELRRKLELLFTLLQNQLAKKEADLRLQLLFDADYTVWGKIIHSEVLYASVEVLV